MVVSKGGGFKTTLSGEGLRGAASPHFALWGLCGGRASSGLLSLQARAQRPQARAAVLRLQLRCGFLQGAGQGRLCETEALGHLQRKCHCAHERE